MKYTRVAIYTCQRCLQEIEPPSRDDSCGSGYGINADGDKHCYPCCGDLDREYMISNGRMTLYLVEGLAPYYDGVLDEWARLAGAAIYPQPKRMAHYVTNWPNSLSFRTLSSPSRSRHNMARWRYDVHFIGPDGYIWHGYQCGDMTQICHCKRTKQLAQLAGA